MKTIITGPRQVGKSTALNRILENCPQYSHIGFKTLFSKDHSLFLCHADENDNCLNLVAKQKDDYMEVIPGSFDKLADVFLHPANENEILVMDELGYLEANENFFKNAVINSAKDSENFIAVIRDGFPAWTKELTKISGTRIIKLFECCESTSDECRALMFSQGFERIAVISRAQSKGRGRQGRSFLSPKDKGLYLSYGFYSDRKRDELPLYSLEIAQIVSDILKEETGLCAEIKAPNDIMFKGKKLCGILPDLFFDENGRAMLIIGIGINLLEDEDDFGELKDIATSVKLSCGKNPDPMIFAQDLLDKLEKL